MTEAGASSLVSVVVATFGRPDALRCALGSLVMQEHQSWEAIVVGDHCGPETSEAVASVGDERIRYYNLPRRFGEQSGPNNAGLHLARGDFIVFLNHDDLLLQDHLRYSISELERANGAFFVGLHAEASHTRLDENDRTIPVFTHIGPARSDLERLIAPANGLGEPCSLWVVRSTLARAIGPWRPAVQLVRSPLRDWILRAWRRHGHFQLGAMVTGLRFSTHRGRQGAKYGRPSPEHAEMLTWMAGHSPDECRLLVEQQVREADRTTGGRLSWPTLRRVSLPVAGSLYRRSGLDLVATANRLRGRERGEHLARALRGRTGEALPRSPSIEEFLADPAHHRVL